MGGWTGIGKDGISWDGTIFCNKLVGDYDDKFWNKSGSIITPLNSTDELVIYGNVGIGATSVSSAILSVGKTGTTATFTGIAVSPTGSGINLNGVNGYPILTTGDFSSKTITGLNYGTFSVAQNISGSPTCKGINVFGYGDFGSDSVLGDVYSIYVENMRLFSNTITANSWTGIKILDGVGPGYFDSLPNQYGLVIEKPTTATANYQEVLLGNGTGSGIWFDGTTGERFWSDGSGLLLGGYNSTANYSKFATNGDQTFAGTAGFYPRRIRQDSPPAAGTGSTQIDTGEMLFWCDSNDSDATYLMYNDTTKGIIKIKLEP